MDKIKEFCKKHSKKIMIGCSVLGAACTFIAGYKIGYNTKDLEDYNIEICLIPKESTEQEA